jgi:starvation-inducible DNA-binding protein
MAVMTLTQNNKNNHSQKVADELAHFLADTYALYLKTQNFHWNVTGPNFHSLHLMFETQYNELAAAVDLIAERIRALRCSVPASFSQFMKLTSLKETTHTLIAKDMLKQLTKDHETIINHAYIILTKAQKAHDEGTMDLLIERIREHEKTAWMLRSCLE